MKLSSRTTTLLWFSCIGVLFILKLIVNLDCQTENFIMTVSYLCLLLWITEVSQKKIQKAEREASDYHRELIALHKFNQENNVQ